MTDFHETVWNNLSNLTMLKGRTVLINCLDDDNPFTVRTEITQVPMGDMRGQETLEFGIRTVYLGEFDVQPVAILWNAEGLDPTSQVVYNDTGSGSISKAQIELN